MKRLQVHLYLDQENGIRVGELAEKDHRIYFQYDTDFLNKSLRLSPYQLPLRPDLFEHQDREFGPIFGLFDDSLPDGWGLLLMDRFLRSKGLSIERLSVLDRLSFLGSNTMGALTYQPEMDIEITDTSHFDLYNLYLQSQELITGKTKTVLSQLMKAGGSPGGARPKVLVGVCKDQLVSGEGALPKGFEYWLVKFNSSPDFPDAGRVEYAYSLMAKDCGITMPETRLFHTENKEYFFGVKRFDRDNHQRIHFHTFGNLIHSNFRIPACDYELFFRVINGLTKNQQDLVRGVRQMVFNVLSNNRDDHVKNFAFLMNQAGEWSLSPAYDLTYSQGPGGEHSMTVAGEGKSPTSTDMLKLAQKAGLKKRDANLIIDQVSQTILNWSKFAKDASVSEKTLRTVQKTINSNISNMKR